MKNIKFNKNLFIIVEGLDGAGKDTFIYNFMKHLKFNSLLGVTKYTNFWVTREPTNITDSGKLVSQKLKTNNLTSEEAVSLFIKDRIQHSKIIRDILNHSYVISSRFDISTYIYQLTHFLMESKNNNLNLEEKDLINFFEDLYKKHKYDSEDGVLIPNISIFLQVNPEIAVERITKRGDAKEFYETLSFQKNLYRFSNFVIERLRNKGRNIIVLDASKDKEKVLKDAIDLLS